MLKETLRNIKESEKGDGSIFMLSLGYLKKRTGEK
jgi:hypothetical protein